MVTKTKAKPAAKVKTAKVKTAKVKTAKVKAAKVKAAKVKAKPAVDLGLTKKGLPRQRAPGAGRKPVVGTEPAQRYTVSLDKDSHAELLKFPIEGKDGKKVTGNLSAVVRALAAMARSMRLGHARPVPVTTQAKAAKAAKDAAARPKRVRKAAKPPQDGAVDGAGAPSETVKRVRTRIARPKARKEAPVPSLDAVPVQAPDVVQAQQAGGPF